MYFYYTIRREMETVIWEGRKTCKKCGMDSDFHLKKLVEKPEIFGISFMSKTCKRFLVCDTCNYPIEIGKMHYKKVKKEQTALFKKGGFPEKVLINDCHPRETGFWWKLLKLILSSGWMAVWVWCAILLLNDMLRRGVDMPTVFFTFLGFTIFGAVPFILSLVHFIPAFKKTLIYAALKRKYKSGT